MNDKNKPQENEFKNCFAVEEVTQYRLCFYDNAGNKHYITSSTDRSKIEDHIKSYEGVNVDYSMMDISKPFYHSYN